MNAPIKNFPLWVKLPLLVSMFAFNAGLASYVIILLLKPIFGVELSQLESLFTGNIKTPREINAFLSFEGISNIFMFLLTAVMYSKLSWGSARERLNMNYYTPLKMVLVAVFAILVAQFFMDFLVELNSKIPLPGFLSSWREGAKKAEELLNNVLNFRNTGQFILSVLVLAVIPAISEEFFFRGLLLGGMLRLKIHPGLSILVTGLIFALSHWEFDNTLAILLLGVFLGYLYYVSGSIWLPVAAHFTNNFFQVVLKYFSDAGYAGKDLSNTPMPLYVTAISFLLFAGCWYVLDRWKHPVDYREEPAVPAQDHTDWMR